MRRRPDVLWAQPNYRRHALRVPNDPFLPLQWHYPLISLPAAWDVTIGSPDVIVAANDDMALGALEAVKARDLADKVKIIGFDALPEALAAVRDGGLAGTVEQFPGGQSRKAMQIMVDHVKNGAKPESDLVLLTPIVITKDNLDKSERLGEVK